MHLKWNGLSFLLILWLMGLGGCATTLGQHPCEDNGCYGISLWQGAIDRIAQTNFPDDHYIGEIFMDNLDNAWTTQDDKVNITSGLLQNLTSMGDAYVASVAAHEIAHLRSHHFLIKAETAYFSLLGSLIMNVFSHENGRKTLLNENPEVAALSRKHELEADRLAVQYLIRAGYTQEDYLKFLIWMKRNIEDAPPSELATHPPAMERITRIQELAPAPDK